MRHEVEELTVEPVDKAVLGLAEPRRAFGDHVEHRLNIGRRPTDDVEHFADRGLIFERFLHLARARVHVLEQPHVLDRDHRLVGEGRDQIDLLGREWTHVRAAQRKGTDRLLLPQ